MKGLILAAGEGTRLAELNLKHKSFAVVKKQHIINFSLDLLADVGKSADVEPIKEIVIVVGHNADAVMECIGNEYKSIPVTYVYQAERKGIGHAMRLAKDALNDDFILCLADEILLNPRMDEMIKYFNEKKAACVCGCILDSTDQSGKPIGYIVNPNKEITKVEEKPSAYYNEYRGVGECIFSKDCLPLLDILQPNAKRGEFEMGDYIANIVRAARGGAFVFDLADAYVNVNYARDIEVANKLLGE